MKCQVWNPPNQQHILLSYLRNKTKNQNRLIGTTLLFILLSGTTTNIDLFV